MGKMSDLVISVLGGIIANILLQAVASFASIPITTDVGYGLLITVNKHIISMSSLVFLFMYFSSNNKAINNSPSESMLIMFIGLLCSIPVGYVVSILLAVKFVFAIYTIYFIELVFFVLSFAFAETY